MKSLDVILSLPVLFAFMAGATAVADTEAATQSVLERGSILPYVAGALLFAFLASALYFLTSELRAERKEKREKKNR